MVDFSLAGKTALITGASSGIGARMSHALAQAGANLLLIARRKNHLLNQQNKLTEAFPQVGINTLCIDLLKHSDWDSLAKQILQITERTDIICNVAGVNLRQPAMEISENSWNQTLDINLKVPFFLSRSLIEPMKKNGWGRIINIASLQSARAFPNSIPYGASKGGICQLTRAMAEEWSKYGIAINAIAPGFFSTELTKPIFEDTEKAEAFARLTACKRNGKMKDLDGITVFLASPASDYITGQTIFLDGGFTAS